MALNKKVTALFKLMERFLTQKEISAYDETLLEEFGCDKKTLGRYLNEIESLYDHIITIKKSRQNVWRLVSVSDIFQEFINNSDDIAELFLMAREFDRDIFQEVEKSTLAKVAKNDENVFLFKNSIMEELNTPKSKKIFDELKRAIRHHEYRNIVYTYNEKQYEV
ncbi:MAG TPA: hypothetical protein ENK66_10690, partial [Arcobacter sp.]|nr:hypothetical protein [Arcobacter sp.]